MPTTSTLGRRQTGAALGALGALIAGVLVAAPTASTAAASSTRDLSFEVQQATTNPGQYQIAASDETQELFVTSASGRPPVVVSTISKIDPVTLQVKARANLPIIPHGATGNQFKRLSVHGIDVDDSTNTVWVTNTRDNQVSVYDRDTLALKHTTYETGGPVTQVEISHPREVVVDETRGRAYVTAANRGGATDASVTVYDTTTFEVVKEIAITAREDYPAEGDSTYAVPMGLAIDEASGRVFANDIQTDEYYVVNAFDYSYTRHAIPNPTVGTDGAGKRQPSSVAVNIGRNELYSANQGRQPVDGETGEGQGSLDVIDLTTNTVKYTLKTGPRALGVAADTDNDLVYVADFGNGDVTVVDARSGEIVEKIATDRNTEDAITPKANHIEVFNGSAYMVDKSGDQPGSVDYAVNLDTGAIESKDVSSDSITKVTPKASIAVQRATVVGGKLTVDGSFLRSRLGNVGSKIGVKLEQLDPAAPTAPGASFDHVADHTVHANATIWAVVDADANGKLNIEINLPDGTTEGPNGSTTALTPGTYGVRFLTGALLAPAGSDVVRSIKLPFTVGARPVVTPPAPTTPVVQALKSTKKPVISGSARKGRTLKVSKGSWNTGSVKVTYRWTRNGKAISGATKSSYKVKSADRSKKIRVQVTATKTGWTKATVTTNAKKVSKKKK